jgi:TatD DNase family protein
LFRFPNLPRLDCHAHIAPDVTAPQVRRLGEAVVFAVTRTLTEGAHAAARQDQRLVWGWGAHPAVPEALAGFSAARAANLTRQLPLVGEVGLDRRGHLALQQKIFDAVLSATQGQPVLLSVHSTGRVGAVLDALAAHPHPGLILHWFLGDGGELARAVDTGVYFSVNTTMPTDLLQSIPPERMLPETDFPSSRRRGGGRLPGDTEPVEQLVADLSGTSPQEIRRRFWTNLRRLAVDAKVIDRFPEPVADLLLTL